MKITEQQQQWLQKYLYQAVNYRETYEEVYDHILTALESKPQTEAFESTVSEIIFEDFGGNNSLLAMEQDCKNAVVKDVIKQYRGYFYGFFKFPLLLYTTGMFVAGSP